MLETRNERILRIKKEKQSQKVQMMNQSFKRSLIVVGTTACVGLYVSPVDQLLSANFSVVEASTAATQFLRNIIPAAQNVARGKDIYTSVMIAQAALESGWGTSALSKAPNHNLFGVKGSYNGQSVNMQTLEDSGGQNYYSIQANFRKYPSYQESLEDYADKIVNGISGAPLFYSGAWKSKTNSYQDATAYLTGRYATDTAYGSKLNRIIEQFGLTKYDTETAVNMAEEIANQQTTTSSGDGYTVVSGDSLYAIARKTGTSIQDLLSLNGLNLNSIIHPGQVLALSSKAASTETKQEESAPKEETKSTETSTTTSTGSYTVVSGDGLYAIARKTGTSIQDLLSLNGLTLNSTIYPGQVLKLSSTSETSASEEASTSTEETSTEETSTSSEQATSTGSYTVVSGDGLYAIARKTGTSIKDLLSLNGLTLNSTIYPGQVLKLSSTSEVSVSEETTSAEETSSEESASNEVQTSSSSGSYTVVSGDSLYAIARKTGTSIQDLLSLNGLTLNSTIYPGQVLKLSSTSETSASEEASTSTEETSTEETSTSSEQATSTGSYTVVSGDGLYAIARKTGTSIKDLLSLNGLTLNSTIYPGQVLKLSSTSEVSVSEETTSAEETSSEESASNEVQTSSSSGSYTVVSGDSLYAIARKTGTSIQDLLSLNGLNLNSVIHPGQVLQLSNAYESSSTEETVTTTEETASSEETTTSGNAQMYYVHQGDTLYRIARNNGISLSTLLEWNNLSVDSPIHPGQGLIVSYGSSSSSEESNTTTQSYESTYTVKAGDGLWRIAKNHGLTLDELKSMNQLTSNIIQPGQVLIVSK